MNKACLLLIILFIMFGLSVQGNAAPVYNPSTGHMYELVFGNWWIAENNAIALGGHLVTINNQAEQDWLVNKFGSTLAYWIGLNDFVSDNHYVWSSGEPVTFTNWARYYDNNSDWYDSIVMNSEGAGKWNYACLPCASSGIAEWQTNSVPEPSTFVLMGMGLTTMAIWEMRRILNPG